MSGKIKPELKLYQDTYKDKDYSSITELSRAMQSEATLLTPIVTHMIYNDKEYGKKNFPILAYTEGSKAGIEGKAKTITKVKLDDANFEYKYPVMGAPKKSSLVVRSYYTAGDRPGLGGSIFKIVFADRWFYRQQTLYPPTINRAQLQCRVQEDPIPVSDGWEYTVKIFAGTSGLYMPLSCLAQGSVWTGGVAKVPFEGSKGTESRSQMPSMATNMISMHRNSYKYKGNLAKKVMRFHIPIDGKLFKSYMDYELYMSMLYFNEAREHDIWWSQYAKSNTGEFYTVDNETSIPITSGAGIDQQIPTSNIDTYSILTYNKFFNMVRDVTFNITDEVSDIHVYTGKGGMEGFDKMIKNELKGFTQLIDSRQFSKGENTWDMVYGSFFSSFRHIDGQMLTVHYHPMFDRGVYAEGQPKHPVSGLPICSHHFYFIDQTVYQGEANLQYIVQDGAENINFVVPGVYTPMGYPETVYRATDRDATSIENVRTGGIQIKRPSSCFKLLCNLGQ
jgi:hypothetical protein